jgi:hypothetical protein
LLRRAGLRKGGGTAELRLCVGLCGRPELRLCLELRLLEWMWRRLRLRASLLLAALLPEEPHRLV